MKSTLSLALFIVCYQFLCGQIIVANPQGGMCGADHMRDALHQSQPKKLQFHQLLERTWYRRQMNGQTSTSRQLYTIPTVVHIIHNNGPANIGDAQVQAAMASLNDAMRNRGIFDPNTGVDVEIEFCLATQDPTGNITNGITRTVSTYTDFTMETEDLLMKGLSRWDPTQYLNIWVVNSITSLSSGPGVAGYAYFPTSHGAPEDGIVGEALYFDSPNDKISVFAHEAGHYLGLYHTFQGGCPNNDCLADGDRVCDTPPDASTNAVTCSATPNTCTSDVDDTNVRNPFRPTSMGGLGDQPDMIINYMDYGDPGCYSAFTQGQKDRMVMALTGARSSLLQSIGCQSPCLQPVTASFTFGGLPVGVSGNVQLNAVVTGPVSTYNWEVNGLSFSQNPNANYTFSQVGTYIFTLTVEGTDPNCRNTARDTLEVFCEPRADFTGFQSVIKPNDIMQLTASGTGNFVWLVNGVQVATGPVYNYSSAQPGSAIIQLVKDNGACSDTSAGALVKVGDCIVDDNGQKMHWALDVGYMLDFHANPPTITANSSSMKGTGNIFFIENSITMSDPNGNLLFYCNGDTLWDSNHQPMPNGSDLDGSPSTVEATFSFPDPGNPDIYYLITLDAFENGYRGGLSYSKIDMRLRGGLGDVIPGEKNRLIKITNNERFACVYHANGRDVWITASVNSGTASNPTWTIESFLVTAAGVSTTPVVSPGITSANGFLKFSHDGTWLFIGNLQGNLCRFDAVTGVASIFSSISSTNLSVFGAEFSPDNSKLYISSSLDSLVQFDLSSGMPGNIAASRYLVAKDVPGQNFSPAKVELGPDGRVYVRVREASSNPTLPYIQDPNLAGAACNFQYSGIPFLPNINLRMRSFNLPSYIRGRSGNRNLEALVSDPVPCFGQEMKVWTQGQTSSAVLEYEFQGQGDTTVVNDTLYITPTTLGAMRVIATMVDGCGVIKDTVDFSVRKGPVIDLGPDRLLCTNPLDLEAAQFPDAQYQWSDNSTNRQLSVTRSGTYWLTITDIVSGCVASDTVTLSDPPPIPQPDLGNDTSVCGGSVLPLYPGNNYADIRWQDNSRDPSFTTFLPGKYWVTVFDICKNEASDTIVIDHIPVPSLGFPDGLSFCAGKDVSLDVSVQGLQDFRWDDGPTGAMRSFTQPGTYYLQAENSIGCTVRDTLIVVEYPSAPAIPLTPVDSFCKGEKFSIDVEDPLLKNYRWDDGVAGPARGFGEGGLYTVTAEDVNGCLSKASIQVVELVPPEIQLPSRLNVCRPDSVILDATTFGLFDYGWNDGEKNPERTIFRTSSYTVSAVDEFGCVSQAISKVFIENCLSPIQMPTGFTPNGDGHNERFGPVFESQLADVQLSIYNRWGMLIYTGAGTQASWNGMHKGSPSPEGVYTFLLQYRTADGRIAKQNGTLTLLR